MMKKLFKIAGRNKLYIILAIFLISINLLTFYAERKLAEKEAAAQTEAAVEEKEPPAPKTVFDAEEIAAREKRLKEVGEENPLLFLFVGLFNLAIIFFIFIGFLFDGYFLGRFLRKKPLQIRTNVLETPRWNIADIIRVTLIFLSCGYLFAIIQAFVTDAFPILKNENFRMVFNTALMNIIGISVILYFVVRKYHQNIAAIGLTIKKAGTNVLYATVGYLSLIPIILVIMVITFFVVKWLQYKPPVQPIVQVFMEEKQTSVLWMSTLFAAIFGPVAEEIFFRGFVYSAVKRTIGVLGSMLVTSAIFAFLHAHIVGFLPIMALGLLLAYIYEKTGSLVSCISVHIMHNVAMVMLIFLVRSLGV